MIDKNSPSTNQTGEFLLYQTEDGSSHIQCRFEGETIWLTQAQIAELFQTTPQNITLHLKAVFADGELNEMATCKDYLQVRQEGGREVLRNLHHYNLSERELLNHAGKISAESARAKAEKEYVRYRSLQDAQPRSVDAHFEQAAKQIQDTAKKLPKGKKVQTRKGGDA